MGRVGPKNWGWRMTFVAVGLPGILIAIILYFTVAEPKRGSAERTAPATPADSNAPRFKAVAGHMWRVRSIRHLCIGATLAGRVDRREC